MPAGAHYQINQASNPIPTGTQDVARTDVRAAQLVHFIGDSSSGQTSPEWTITAWPPGAARTQPTNRTTFDATYTAVPGSYKVQYTVLDGLGANLKKFIFAVTRDANGLIIDDGIREPAFGEEVGDDNSGGNDRGYAPAVEAGIAAQVPVVATMAALISRIAVKHKQVRLVCFAVPDDNGGGPFNWDSASTLPHNGGTIIQPGFGTGAVLATGRWIRQFSGAMHAEWFGLIGSTTIVHNANGTDTAKAVTNKAALLALGNALNAQGGGTGLIPAGNFAMVVGATCLAPSGWTGVVLEGHGREVSLFFDPQVAATVPEPGVGGAFFMPTNSTRCCVRKLGFRGSADLPSQVPIALLRTDRKGIYWHYPSTDCTTEDCSFEGTEGEMWFYDGGLAQPTVRCTARHIRWKDVLGPVFNMGAGIGGSFDCGVSDAEGEGHGSAVLEGAGVRWYFRDVIARGGGLVNGSDQILIEDSDGFELENVTLADMDLRLGGGVSGVRLGIAGHIYGGTMRNIKLRNVQVTSGAGLYNGHFSVQAINSGVGSGDITGLVIDGVDIDECGGTTNGGLLTGLRLAGPNKLDVKVLNVRVRNGSTGSVTCGVRLDNTAPVTNNVTFGRCTIDDDVAVPFKFEVAPRHDFTSRRLLDPTLSDANSIITMRNILVAHGLVRTNFLPTDITSANVTGWYDASVGIVLGGTLKKSGTSPPTVQIAGNVTQAVGIKIQIDSTAGGTGRGQATFKWSIDNGATWVATGVLTAATVTLGTTGINAVFSVGLYNTNNIYEATVDIWQDLVGGNNIEALTSAGQPRFLVNRQNSKPGLAADGVDDYMAVAYTRNKPSFMYIVQRADSGVTSGTIADGLSQNSCRFYRTGAAQLSAFAGSALNGAGADPEHFHIWRVLWNAGSSYIKEGAATLVSGATGATGDASGFSIAGFGGSSDFYAGTYLEIICLDAAPSAGDDASMLASLQAKYAL